MEEPSLLLAEHLIKTGDVDHADWNFRGILGRIQRTRFRMALDLLQKQKHRRLLEIGYGSGIFMPELARHCRELYGIDVHDKPKDVMSILAGVGVEARLFQGTAESLPFPSAFFDCIVAVSSLEFVGDIDKASAEIRRVLSAQGRLILVTPGHSPVVDLGLRILTGEVRPEGLRKPAAGLAAGPGKEFPDRGAADVSACDRIELLVSGAEADG